MAQLSRLVDARCDAAREEERPLRGFSGSASKEGGAKNGAGRSEGRSPTLQKARQGGSRLVEFWSGFCPGSERGQFWSSNCYGSSNLVVVELFLVGGSVGVGAVPRPRKWDGAPAIPPSPPVRTEIVAKTRPFPQYPVRAVGRTTRAGARHEPVDHAGGTRS